MITKALKYTAKPLQGYTHIDYGSGLVNIPKAYEYLKLLAERGDQKSPAYYEIHTGNTFYRDISGPAAFWKSNGYFPEEGDKQNVMIQAVFPDHTSEEERAKFYRAFSLRSDADWLSTDKSSIYIRSDQPASIGLLYDHSKMKKPGIYSGRVYAYTEDVKNGGNPDFDIQATVVIPYEFTKENNFSRKFENGSLETGDIQRNFVQVPPGASSMNVSLDPSGDKWFEMGLYLYTPDGNRAYSSFATDNKERKGISFRIPGNDLPEGIWEAIPYCYYQSRNVSHYDLEIKFYGVRSQPETISEIRNPVGELPHINCEVTNVYNELLSADLTGVISGYCMKNEFSQTGKPKFTRKIKTAQNIKSVEFNIQMPVEEYNKMTDLAVNIYNTEGKAVFSTGMSRKYKKFTFNPPAAGEYTLEIVPAFTSEEIQAEEWIYSIEETYNYINSIYLKPENSSEMLYPGVPKSLRFTATDPLPMAPEGTNTCGKVIMTDKKDGNLIKEIQVLLK